MRFAPRQTGTQRPVNQPGPKGHQKPSLRSLQLPPAQRVSHHQARRPLRLRTVEHDLAMPMPIAAGDARR